MATLTGQTIAGYKIEAPLAKGGMGAIYRARQLSNGREVAFKVMLSDATEEGSLIQRFKREAEVLSSLKHANIIDVYDYGESDGVLYMVMPLLTHGTLGDKMRRARLTNDEIRQTMIQVAGAMQYAHSQHIVHRDLKPENILLDAAGNCKVCDFGIVSIQDASTRLSKVGTLMGSAHYMAPEQCNGAAVDARTDIYALGVILFQMATGQLPFTGDSWNAVALQQITKTPESPRTLNGSLSPAIERTILKALEKKPQDRFDTAAAFSTAVDRAFSSSTVAAAGTTAATEQSLKTLVYQPGDPPANPPRRVDRRGLLIGAGFVGLAGAGAFAFRALRTPETATPSQTSVASATLRSTSNTVAPPINIIATEPASIPPTAPTASVAVAIVPPSVRKVGSDRVILGFAGGAALELIRIPAGEFTMGSDDKDDEKPIKKLNLPEYLIGRTEVTVAQYAVFAAATGYKSQAERDGSSYGYDGSTYLEIAGAYWAAPLGPGSDVRMKQNHPVSHLSWRDCMTFCEWAQRVTGLAFMLPSEAQWEKAARGAGGRLYPWGEPLPDDTRANFNLNVKDTNEVGKYGIVGVSPYGLDDMAGNVAEWTLSKYMPYPYDAKDGREDPVGDADDRVLRGGSWFDSDFDLRCSNRSDSEAANRAANLGFRVCIAKALAAL